MKLKDIKLVEGVYNQKYKDADDWQEDYAEDTGWSAICPNCGSTKVHQAGDMMKHRLDAVHYECEDCGHRSGWKGSHSHIAQKRFGHPSKQPHQYHDPDAKK